MNPMDVPSIEVDELPAGAVLLDVREDDEWRAGHIDGALHVPMNQVPQRLRDDPGPLTPEAAIVVVCKVGGRSAQVTAWLRQQGFDAVNLAGGMMSWDGANRPMTASDGQPPRVA